ncbi:Hypothetical predicted protein, partial [Marmota monax]
MAENTFEVQYEFSSDGFIQEVVNSSVSVCVWMCVECVREPVWMGKGAECQATILEYPWNIYAENRIQSQVMLLSTFRAPDSLWGLSIYRTPGILPGCFYGSLK